jgi:ABC-type multidrug transport system fused ATPase/permease subunit
LWVTTGSGLVVNIRRTLFESMMRSEVEYFDRNPIGGILALFSEEARTVQDAFGFMKGTQLQVIGTFVTGIICHFISRWQMALIHMGALVLVAVMSPPFMKRAGAHFGKKFFL